MSGLLNLIVAVVCLALVPALWFARRRWFPKYPKDRCRQCGYDLRTHGDAVLSICSECGYEQEIRPGSIEVKRIYARLLVALAMPALLIVSCNRGINTATVTTMGDWKQKVTIRFVTDETLLNEYGRWQGHHVRGETVQRELTRRLDKHDDTLPAKSAIRDLLVSYLASLDTFDQTYQAIVNREATRFISWREHDLIDAQQLGAMVLRSWDTEVSFSTDEIPDDALTERSVTASLDSVTFSLASDTMTSLAGSIILELRSDSHANTSILEVDNVRIGWPPDFADFDAGIGPRFRNFTRFQLGAADLLDTKLYTPTLTLTLVTYRNDDIESDTPKSNAEPFAEHTQVYTDFELRRSRTRRGRNGFDMIMFQPSSP